MSDDPITIVSGLPRSGTSLMMQMLEAGGLPALTDGARAGDDDNPRGYYELEAAKRIKRGTAWLADAPGRVVKLVHALLEHLPGGHEYRVVFMRRDLREVVLSQRVMLERLGAEGANLTPEQLISAFQGQLRRVDAWLAERPHFSVLNVSYNELITDPAPVATAVNRFLGGGLDEAPMVACVDPALYRQRLTTQGT